MNKDHQHIDDFFKDASKNKHPFKTPDNYFNELPDKVADDLFLNSLPKETGHKVPDNYFNNLSENLATGILEQSFPKQTGLKTPDHYFENFTVKKPRRKIISLVPYISTAAAILIGFFIFNNNNNTTILDELSSEEIISYLSTDSDLNSSYVIDNTLINTNDTFFASIDNIDIDINQLEMEVSEYDILDY